MMRPSLKCRFFAGCFAVLAMTCGCDRSEPPAQKNEAKPAGNQQPAAKPAASQPDSADLAKLRGFVTDKAAPAAPAGLPPDHPRLPTPESAPPALPPDHPPIGAAAPGMPGGPKPPGADVPSLKFDAPTHWKQQPVSSAFRRAQYAIPHAATDAEDGLMVLFYFGPNEGGPVAANLDRWVSQFATAEGEPVSGDGLKREQRTIGGLSATLLDVTGRYSDRMLFPQRNGPTEGDWRLLGAVVETPAGNWFFKAVGPAATMAGERDAFVKMLESVKP